MTGIVLGDDHAVFVESLVSVLTMEGFTVLAVSGSLTGTIEAVREHRPKICLLDRHFADGDGVAGIERVIAASPRTQVLMLTADGDADAMLRAVKVGASGYVHKTWGVRYLVEAVERVMKGEVVIEAPRGTQRRSPSSEARRLAEHLTARERQCLALLVEGLDTKSMTARLGVSTTTVRSHIQALLTKLGVHSRLEAASLAVRYDLVDHATRAVPPGAEGRSGTG
ncbi:MAG TPA: response regulator transcription factor [Pseudonocardiaceae bacterium]